MIEFKESKFYKLLQDFSLNNDKETFLQLLAEFYNRTEGIIDKNIIQDELIKELRELYIEFNEKGIDDNIVREKVNYFVENSNKIQDIITKLIKNTNNIKNITSQLKDIVNYNVAQSPLFNVNDVSIAINDIVGKLKENDNIFLPNISCKFKNTINLTNIPNGVTIDFRGELTEAIRFTGKKATLKLNKLIGNSTSTNGLVLGGNGECHDNTIEFSQISNFNYGLYLNPLNDNGVQYNKINFKNIEKCNTCILFDCVADSQVNENTFYGGSVGDWNKVSKYGIKFINGNITSDIGYNDNKFYNIGFEGLSKDAVTLHNSPWNSFINCRMLESINGKYIVDDNTSDGNTFIFSAILPIEKIELVSNMCSYIGPLMEGTSQSYRYSGFDIDKDGKRRYSVINGFYTTATNSTMKTIDSTTVNLDITSANSEVNVKLSNDIDYEGNEITIRVVEHINPINFYAPDGTTKLDKIILDKAGLYKLRKINNSWCSFYIGFYLPKLDAVYSSATTLELLIQDFQKLLSDLKTKGYMSY